MCLECDVLYKIDSGSCINDNRFDIFTGGSKNDEYAQDEIIWNTLNNKFNVSNDMILVFLKLILIMSIAV